MKEFLTTISNRMKNVWLIRTGRFRVRPRAAILVYHRVGEATFDPHQQAVSPDHFRQHLRHLRQGYQVLSLPELLKLLPRGEYPDGTVVITFDDGYVDNLTNAQPIAAQFDLPMTVFVTVQPILQDRLFWWDEVAVYSFTQAPRTRGAEFVDCNSKKAKPSLPINVAKSPGTGDSLHSILKRMTGCERQLAIEPCRATTSPEVWESTVGRPMTVPELQQLAALPGLTIGSHTMTHPVLSALPVEQQLEELTVSKQTLEELLKKEVSLVAYPFGKSTDVSRETYGLAERAGYRAALTTLPKPVTPSTEPFAIPRMAVHNWSEEEFARRMRELFGRSPL